MAIDINIPSQVKNYTNLAAFPASGALKTIYIANDTNKTYRWTGSAYVEISGTDTSSLVPTTRTLTINGTTQDLSADRTFTISTGITIGTTAITSGTVGRVLFEGTGNVVTESANMTFDNSTGVFQLTTTADNIFGLRLKSTTGQAKFKPYLNSSYGFLIESKNSADSALLPMSLSSNKLLLLDGNVIINSASDNGAKFQITSGGATSATTSFTITNTSSTRLLQIWDDGNIGVNTTTNAGYKLDVNGTARVSGNTQFSGNVGLGSTLYNDKLEVYGNILVRANDRIRLAGTSDGNTALWANSGSSAQMNVKNGSGSAFDITFGNIGSTTRMLRVHSYDSTTPSVVVGNNATAFASSVLTVESTTQGFLPPRMTSAQKNAIASPVAGLMVYDTTLNVISYYNGTMWL